MKNMTLDGINSVTIKMNMTIRNGINNVTIKWYEEYYFRWYKK